MRSSTNSAQRSSEHYRASIAAAVAAAGAAYFLDPRSGRRRRALLRDQADRIGHQTREFVAKAGRDASHRARGLYQEAVSRFRMSGIDDRILEERIRAELGRLSSHPHAIELTCSKGVARMRGDILESELDAVLHGVRKVRGVRSIVNEMHVHREAGRIPSLQGGSNFRPAPRLEYLQSNWSPAPRLLAGVAGFAMIVAGLARRSAPGAGIAAAGAALLGRSIFNRPLSDLFGLRTSAEDGVLVQKTIQVYADTDEVYSRWRNLESLPEFMSHVRKVRKVDDTHYHWKVDGPAGVPVEWDAEITADVPGELIAWRTTQDAAVRSTGVVHFEPTSFGGTRVHVRMSYRPPANVVGHTIAKILGRDPKRQLDADLLRFKSFVETGRTAGPGKGRQERGAGEGAAAATRH